MGSCNVAQRELVCRSISFGPVDPYTEELNSDAYKSQLIDGSVGATKNAYAPGGQCTQALGDDGLAYYNSHTNPMAWGWKWANNTWNAPPDGDPKGMRWDGKNFVGPRISKR